MAAEDNKNMPKLVASMDTTDDPRIFMNHENINPPQQQHRQQHQQPSNCFGPAGNSNIDNSNAALISFNSGGLPLPPQVGIPIPAPHPPLVVAADDQVTDNDGEYFSSFPPGYRFCPLDRELIVDYLYPKVHDLPLPRNQIREVNLYRYTPDTITDLYPSTSENQWYFFTQRDKKYLNGARPNRAAGTGFWKATGADKAIYGNKSQTTNAIGFRKALVYYEGKPPRGNKTNWIMHEFKLHSDLKKSPIKNSRPRPANDMRLEGFVLCKLYKKINKSLKSTSSNDDNGSEEVVERDGEVANGENDTQAINFAPSSSKVIKGENSSQAFNFASSNALRPPYLPHPHNEVSYPSSIRIPANPIPIQSSCQTDYHSHYQPELPHLLSFRRYHQHQYPPVSISQVYVSQSYPPPQLPPQQSIFQSYPLHQGQDLREFGLEYDPYEYNPNDNYISQFLFDNATPDSYIDSSSSQPSPEKKL